MLHADATIGSRVLVLLVVGSTVVVSCVPRLGLVILVIYQHPWSRLASIEQIIAIILGCTPVAASMCLLTEGICLAGVGRLVFKSPLDNSQQLHDLEHTFILLKR